ncbi:hypothetical protein I7I53_11875 [Histoplasma capsulatum var. duboisii H88]|uniref:Uncharacterized protein n=1 Tax=Ajellomyces capsulatus (strain H88) TaxID=544711 RepID=A0A8A1LTU8_AJEC8|nr:hypothetical protein I7I53_11875 [Histoplasma capsulatum var. duboisii H88]
MRSNSEQQKKQNRQSSYLLCILPLIPPPFPSHHSFPSYAPSFALLSLNLNLGRQPVYPLQQQFLLSPLFAPIFLTTP